jgi:hypothetical protein
LLRAREGTRGHFLFGSPLETTCDYPANRQPPDTDWIARLRATYGRGGSIVLVDAIPLPSCDPALAYYQHALAGTTDNEMQSLPPDEFITLPARGRHVNAAGAVTVSSLLGDQILQSLQRMRETQGR